MIVIYSFSYRDGGVPAEADAVFDVRSLPNPHGVPGLRRLDGRNPAVRTWLLTQSAHTARMLADAFAFTIRCRGESVAFGCHGGRHRSVALAGMLSILLEQIGVNSEVRHLALGPITRGPDAQV